jgi:hypothetical protein
MSVTYSKQQREVAREKKLYLVSLAVPGFEFQGPATKEEMQAIDTFMSEFLKRRGDRLKKEGVGR